MTDKHAFDYGNITPEMADIKNDEPPPYGQITASASTFSNTNTSKKIGKSEKHMVSGTTFSHPTNYLYRTSKTVTGAFAIDPGMDVPRALLPPLDPGEKDSNRRNLRLTSRGGNINVSLLLLSPSGPVYASKSQTSTPEADEAEGSAGVRTSAGVSQRGQRARMLLTSDNGSTAVRMHTAENAGPYMLEVVVAKGTATVTLPRAFRGLLRLGTTHGRPVRLSRELGNECTPLSDIGCYHRWLVGDLAEAGDLLGGGRRREQWQGTEVKVMGYNASIEVKYADREGGSGLWAKLRGK